MTDLLRKFNNGEKLTLEEQANLVDDYLDMMFASLVSLFPDLHLWTTGSALYNNFSISIDGKVKARLLTKKQLHDEINKCSQCGRENTPDVKQYKRQELGLDDMERKQTFKKKSRSEQK
jgi:hypothetical protein